MNSLRNARDFRARIKLEFGNVGFLVEKRGKAQYLEKILRGAEKRTNNKINPHISPSRDTSVGGEHRASTPLTTAPSLLP